MESSITLGCDPELFLCDREGNVVPAGCMAPDGKQFGPGEGPEIVRDGVLLELRPEPAADVDDLLANVRNTLRCAQEMAAKGRLLLRAEARMPVTHRTLALCDKDALIFGCDPDWSAYTGRKQVIRVDAANHPWRYAGGHIHVGTDALRKPSDLITLCKVFDLFVGLPTVMMDRSPASVKRRKLYGRAGSFRPQPHGFEWRVSSNFWLRTPMLARAVFELSQFAYTVWATGEGAAVLQMMGAQYSDGFQDLLRQTIDMSDERRAKQLLASACTHLVHCDFPLRWWDVAVCLMKADELPFACLSAEWGLAGMDRFDLDRKWPDAFGPAGEIPFAVEYAEPEARIGVPS